MTSMDNAKFQVYLLCRTVHVRAGLGVARDARSEGSLSTRGWIKVWSNGSFVIGFDRLVRPAGWRCLADAAVLLAQSHVRGVRCRHDGRPLESG